MQQTFSTILQQHHFSKEKAETCAKIFTANSVDGVYTHGVNRFPRFVQYIKEGFVKPDAEPTLVYASGGLEQWNGNLGPGVLSAVNATERSMHLASTHTIGCVALANTNHWMRGGYYGWQAAKKGFVFIGWTNTVANMPAWNALDNKLGNNPLVIAIPYNNEAIVLDMAMSQFSFGSLELSAMKGEQLPVNGGFDTSGIFTTDPQQIIASKRPLPIGYWKGAGLSLMLDLLAAILSSGLATYQITNGEAEHALSQVFCTIELKKLSNFSSINSVIENIILDYKQSTPEESKNVTYPGERVLNTRHQNLEKGIPVLQQVWNEVTALLQKA
jgi:3-dehydro-L-gulonate 2-dehydrogenase